MKKPDITEGEWSILIKKSGYHEIKVGEGRYSPTICSVNPNEYSVDGDKDLAQKNAMANIKAIKEVPNMIDELMEYIRTLRSIKHFPTIKEDPVVKGHIDKKLESAIQTAKKAGFEL